MTYSPEMHAGNGISPQDQEKMVWVETLAHLSRRLCLATGLTEIFQLATTLIAEAFQVEKCAVFLYDEARHELVGRAPAFGVDRATIEQIRCSLDEGAPGRLIWEHDKPLVIADPATDPRLANWRALGRSLGLRSLLICPLWVDHWHVGIVVLANKRSSRPFSAAEATFLRALADQVTIALVNARIQHAQAQEAKRGHTLAQMASLLHATLDPRDVVRAAASMVLMAAGADRCHIFVIPGAEASPLPVLSASRTEEGTIQASEGVPGEIIRWFKTHWESLTIDRSTIIEEALLSPLIPSSWITRFHLQTLAVVPMSARDEVWGYMLIEYCRAVRRFDEGEIRFIESIARQSGLAFRNAHLYREVLDELNPLRQSIERYAPLIEGAKVAFLVVQDGRYGYAGGAVTELLGYSSEELFEMYLPDVFASPSQTPVIESYEQILEGGTIPSFEAQIVRKDGQEVTVILSGSLIEFEGRPAVQFVACDTTEQSREREQRLLASKLEAVTRLIGNLVGEARNALTPVVGFTELTLELPDLTPEVKSNLEVIAQGAERAKKTFDTLATWAQIQPPEKSLVNVNHFIRHVLSLKQYELQSHHIEVEWDLQKELPETSLDPQQLQMALLAIVDNARDALLQVPQDRRLVIRTRRQKRGFWKLGEMIEIHIEDNGPGIARENLSRVFDPFFSTKPPTQALGLGLWIAYQIVKNHNGEITVNSREGEGATFIIALPILRGEEPLES